MFSKVAYKGIIPQFACALLCSMGGCSFIIQRAAPYPGRMRAMIKFAYIFVLDLFFSGQFSRFVSAFQYKFQRLSFTNKSLCIVRV